MEIFLVWNYCIYDWNGGTLECITLRTQVGNCDFAPGNFEAIGLNVEEAKNHKG